MNTKCSTPHIPSPSPFCPAARVLLYESARALRKSKMYVDAPAAEGRAECKGRKAEGEWKPKNNKMMLSSSKNNNNYVVATRTARNRRRRRSTRSRRAAAAKYLNEVKLV